MQLPGGAKLVKGGRDQNGLDPVPVAPRRGAQREADGGAAGLVRIGGYAADPDQVATATLDDREGVLTAR